MELDRNVGKNSSLEVELSILGFVINDFIKINNRYILIKSTQSYIVLMTKNN